MGFRVLDFIEDMGFVDGKSSCKKGRSTWGTCKQGLRLLAMRIWCLEVIWPCTFEAFRAQRLLGFKGHMGLKGYMA